MGKPAERMVTVRSRSGVTASVPESSLGEVLAKGWTVETAAQEIARAGKEQYGDSEIGAFLEGAADTVTLGGYSALASTDPEWKEGVRERRARNPKSAVFGEVAGAIATLPAGGPLRFTPGGIAAGAGRAAEAAVAAKTAGLAEGGVLARAANRAVPSMVGAGTEGAVFGAGQGVSEVFLSEDPMNAEAALSTIASRAMAGGAIGAGAGAIGPLVAGAVRPHVIPDGVGADEELLHLLAKGPAGSQASADVRAAARLDYESLGKRISSGEDAVVAERKAAQRAQADWMAEVDVKSQKLHDELLEGYKKGWEVDGQIREILEGRVREKPGPGLRPGEKIPKADIEPPLPDQTGPARAIHRRAAASAEANDTLIDLEAMGPKKVPPHPPGRSVELGDDDILAIGSDPDRLKKALERLRSARQRLELRFDMSRVEKAGEVGKGGKKVYDYSKSTPLTPAELRNKLASHGVMGGEAHEALVDYGLYRDALIDTFRALNPTRQFEWHVFTPAGKDILSLFTRMDEMGALSKIAGRVDTPALVAMRQEYDNLGALVTEQSKEAAALRFRTKAEAAGFSATAEELKHAAGGLDMVLPPAGSYADNALHSQVYAEAAGRKLQAIRDAGAGRSVKEAAGDLVKGAMVGGAVDWIIDGVFGHVLGGLVGGVVARRALRRGAGYVSKRAMKGRLLMARERSDRSISDGIDRFIKGKGGAVVKSATAAMARSAWNRDDNQRQSRAQAQPADATRRISKELAAANADPRKTSEALYERLSDVRLTDLKFYDQVSTLHRNAIAFLAQKAPKPPSPQPFRNKTNWRPGDAEIDRFARYMAVLEEGPSRIVEELAAGRLTTETVEATKAMFPAYYGAVRAQLVARMTDLRAELPYEKRLQLGILFGIPVDESQEPKRLAALQATFEADAQAQAETGGMSKNEIGSVKLKHSTTETPAQSFAG